MSAELRGEIERIWWLSVQPGEFYNIERHPQIKGGGGAMYIEVPSRLVDLTLDFLGHSGVDLNTQGGITIEAAVIWDPGVTAPIEFLAKSPKSGRRLRIARQNRQQRSSQRHPAWTPKYKFPSAPDDVSSTAEARKNFPEGGLRIFLAKTSEDYFYAGYTAGRRPTRIRLGDPNYDLYSSQRGGVIDAQ